MQLIEISAAEHRHQALDESTLLAAKDAVDQDGFVGLVGAMSAENCDRLYNRMIEEYAWLCTQTGPMPVRGVGGFEGERFVGFDPPMRAPYITADLVVNPFAVQVTSAMMGDGIHCANVNSNWSLPTPPGGTPSRQPVHGDAGHLFPGHGWTPPFILNLSVPLVDFTEANGATEIWLGTHRLEPHMSEMDGETRKAAVEARRAEVPPERMVAPKGTIVIRDPRAWHAGMPNLTDRPRIMIAMRHYTFWMRNCTPSKGDRMNERRQIVPAGFEPVFQSEKLRWVLGTIPEPDSEYLVKSVSKVIPGLDVAALSAACRAMVLADAEATSALA